jgi:hypothetical protein
VIQQSKEVTNPTKVEFERKNAHVKVIEKVNQAEPLKTEGYIPVETEESQMCYDKFKNLSDKDFEY